MPYTVPLPIARKKSVLLLTPTTAPPPLSLIQAHAATLAMLFDITARQAAQAAVRRSEALLSHLFATSPDCITLSELPSGRLAMVNPAFSRLTGYAADEVIGRVGDELGLWNDTLERDRLRAALAGDRRIADMPATLRMRSGDLVSALAPLDEASAAALLGGPS